MVAVLPQSPTSASSDDRNDSRIRHPDNQQENVDATGINPRRRPRGRTVASRYLSLSPSHSLSSCSSSSAATASSTSSSSSKLSTTKGLSSPLVSRTYNSNFNVTPTDSRAPSSFPKRSQSAGRSRHPLIARAHSSDFSAATKMLITSSRSLSVSFQGKAFSLPISRKKDTASPNPAPKMALELKKSAQRPRKKEKQRYTSTTHEKNSGSGTGPLSRSLNSFRYGYGLAGKPVLDQSAVDDRKRLDLGNAEELSLLKGDANSTNEMGFCVSCGLSESDTESISSGSTNDVRECDNVNAVAKVDSLRRDFIASARFWQETNSRLRRLHDPGSVLSTSPAVKINASLKSTQSKRFSGDGSMLSPQTKLSTSSALSPSRAFSDPCCIRSGVNGHANHDHGNVPSILSFSPDIRRGKVGEDHAVNAHTLRLLYNHYLQWRLANARADAAFMAQSERAGRYLWNAWVSILELRHSVTLRKIKLQLLRQKLKLTSIIRGQIPYLEEWDHLDKDYSDSLHDATKALQASTVRLPVVGKAVVDMQTLQDAIGSAVDVMEAMLSTVRLLSSKVETTNAVTANLVNVTSREKDLLKQCNGFLSALAAMQVTDSSLKTYLIQLSGWSTIPDRTCRVGHGIELMTSHSRRF